ncbi:MAG TPA: DoxX family protein [Vicinamibacterales bacterium]|nr:DoxX family protein [Vicinamibacterales bacterium]
MALKFRTRSQRASLTGREHEVRPMVSDSREPEDDRSPTEKAALLAGRLIFGGYFLYSGIHHFTDREMLIGYAKSKGVAWPRAAVLGTGALLVVGGLSLITGVKQKVGASLVTTFLTGVTPMMHDYWNVADQARRMNEMINFTKNLALIGGAAFAAAAAARPRATA